jgi:hypothetical protein
VVRINIVNAKNLIYGDTLNSYVKITCLTSGIEYGKTKDRKNINPVWNQVFYIPIYDINKKFKIQVYNNNNNNNNKHVSLGFYILDLKDLIKGKRMDLEHDLIKPKNNILRIPLRSNNGKIHFVANFYSSSELERTTKTTKFYKTTITFYNLCNLITRQCKDGSFEITYELVKLFNFNSKDELIKAITVIIKDDEKVKAFHVDIWGTVLIKGNLISFIDTTIYNFINYIKYFNRILNIFRNSLPTALFKTLLWNDDDENYLPYSNDMDWMKTYNKAKAYLKKIETDVETKKNLRNLAKKFINEHFKINKEELLASWFGEAIRSATGVESQSPQTTKNKLEAIKSFLAKILEETAGSLSDKLRAFAIPQKRTGSSNKIVSKEDFNIESGSNETKKEMEKYEVVVKCGESGVVATKTSTRTEDAYGSFEFSSDTIINILPEEITQEEIVEKADTVIDNQPDQYEEKSEKAEKYLKTELESEEKIKELLETTGTIVVEHANKKVIKEKADKLVVEEIQETITEEESIEVMEIQNNDGSFEKISDKITEKLGITTKEINLSIISNTDERVKKLDTKVLVTFLTLAYCNKVLCKYQSKFKAQIEKARSWLHTQVNDEKLEKGLLEFCEKIIVEKVFDKKKEISCFGDIPK